MQVGVPAASAYAKMAAEGLTPDDVNKFKAAMGEAVMVRPLYQCIRENDGCSCRAFQNKGRF